MSDGREASIHDAGQKIARPEAEGRPVVLQLLPDFAPGALPRHAVEIAAAVSAGGGTPLVASGGGGLEYALGRAGAAHLTLPLASRNLLTIRRNATRLCEIVEQYDVDILHAHAPAPGWCAQIAAERSGRHFVSTIHAPYVGERGLKRKFNAVMTKAERVIAVSDFIAAHIRTNFQIDTARLRSIPLGVDFTNYDPEHVSAERVIKLAGEWRLPDGVPVVMLPAAFRRGNGQMRLIEAAAQLGAEHDFCCLLLGSEGEPPPYKHDLEAQVQRHGLAGRVLIADTCNDMPAAFMLADVVVSAPVEPEGFDLTISQAQALGRPVVALRDGSAPEQILDGHTGFLVQPRTSEALAEGIRRALELTGEARAVMSYAAIGHVRSHFSLEKTTGAIVGLYRELLRSDAYRTARQIPSGIHGA
ncbi:MAG: glycosyltransferase [Rhodovibrionaceae bacterium]